MKKILSLIVACALILSGCGQNQPINIVSETKETTEQESVSDDQNANEEIIESQEPAVVDVDDEDADPTPYEYEVDFDVLNDDELMRYVKDSVYAELVKKLNSDKYFVENISTAYVSQEYIDELTFNSQPNVYFGYTLAELDEAFQGTRFVFTLGDEGDTIVSPFEEYDDTYEKIIKNVATGTGVILVCVTVSVVTGGAGASAASMIFAVSAKTGTILALSSGALSGVAAGAVKGIQTKDMEQAIEAAALAGSEDFKWGAIMGSLAGGASEAVALKGATMKGLKMNEAATIQKEAKYPVEIIKQFHTMDEYEAFKAANLKPYMINGKTALVRTDIDLDVVDEFGRTNLRRMQLGLSPLDAEGTSYELHHIGQEADATLAIFTQAEHDNVALHGFKKISEIDRKIFADQRRKFWKTMANLLEAGGIV